MPIKPPARNIIRENPLSRKCQSAPNSPTKRIRTGSNSSSITGRRSPFLGISALTTNNKPSSSYSLDWDGYTNTPSYYQRHTPIPIVSTPSTSLESTPAGFRMPFVSSPFESPAQQTNTNMVESVVNDSLALQLAKKDVENLIDMFPPEHMTVDRLPVYNNELKEIKDTFRDFSAKLLTFSMKYSTVEEMPLSLSNERMTITWWQNQEQHLSQRVAAHHLKVRQAASSLHGTTDMSDFQKKDLELKEKQIQLLEKNNKRVEENEKIRANALGQNKYDEIVALGVELEDQLSVVEDWSSATRAQVITAMKSLDKWALTFNNLNRAYRDFSLATATYNLPDLAPQVESTMTKLITLYNKVTKDVQDEDSTRELYSLAGVATEQVKLPKFNGNPGEDFSTFKNKLTVAFEKNRVPVADKIEKLRSCLSGQALALVPEKTKDFNSAMDILSDAFGNAEKVLAVRINELKKLGKCPSETVNGKMNYSSIVSFCLKLEVMMQDLIDLAEADDGEQLKFDVYSSSVRTTIQNLFSLRDIMKMRALDGRGKLGLEQHIRYIKEFRVKAQSMIDPVEIKDKSNKRTDSKSLDSDSSKSTHSMFKNPRRYDDCRICGSLETQGDSDLYVNHISESIIGCPKFQAMTAEERRDICLKSKFCIKCCDKEVIFSIQHARSCRVNKSQK